MKVEFTCTVGQHNAHTIEPLIDIASAVSIPVVFQPALNSLFLGTDRDGSSWQLDLPSIRAAFAQIERIKRRNNVVGNGWSSLRHFRRFPEDTRPPCSAGWVQATMDPEGVLFSCPQLNRSDRSTASHGSGRRQHSPICPERAVANAGARAWSREIMPGGCASIACSHRSNACRADPGVLREPRRSEFASTQSASIAPGTSARLISWLDRFRYGPFLAQPSSPGDAILAAAIARNTTKPLNPFPLTSCGNGSSCSATCAPGPSP